MADVYWSSVSLALDFNGSDGSTVFADISAAPKTVTRYGNAQISTAQNKFGGSSGLFDGNGDYLSLGSTHFAVATFTAECFVYLNSTGGNKTIFSQYLGSSPYRTLFDIRSGLLSIFNGSSGLQSGATAMVTGRWYHVAFVRQGATCKGYLDGVLEVTHSAFQTPYATTTLLGSYPTSTTDDFYGYIDDVRITQGIARYIADFSQPSTSYLDAAAPIATAVIAVLDQSWGDADTLTSALFQAWGLRFGADLYQSWSDAPIIKSLLHQPWGNAGVVKAHLVQRWRDMVTLRAALDQPWAIMESLLVTLEQPWAITSGPVQALLDQGWNIRDVEQVMAVLHQPWSIASDGTVLRYTVEVLADGQPVRVSQINIEGGFDDSGDVLTCEIHLATEAEYLLCPFGAELVVTITSQEGTDSFAFVVTSPKPSEAHGNNAWVIEAMSPAVMLGAPYAAVIDGELSGLASEIAATLAGDIALSWETVDWHIPAATWIASGETPLALLKALAAACGALVQSDPDGTIAIRPRYPVSLPNWATATPGHVFVETLDCFENGSTPEHRYGYNRFLVSNQSSSADSLTLEQTDISSTVKEVRGYQVPWDGLFDLTHTGGSWVVIEPVGIEAREEAETIEFVAGAGSTRYPVHGLVSVAWQQTNLGTITTAEDGSLTASIPGQSLCDITYTTRCRLWKVADGKHEQLQLVAEL